MSRLRGATFLFEMTAILSLCIYKRVLSLQDMSFNFRHSINRRDFNLSKSVFNGSCFDPTVSLICDDRDRF